MILYLKVIAMGLVEGITEFLPVSSTGHLILVGELIHFPTHFSTSFEIGIQAGAILAVCWIERLTIFTLLSPANIRKGAFVPYLLACIPPALLGVLSHDFIKSHLFSTTTVAYSLIVGGIIMALVHYAKLNGNTRQLSAITWQQSIGVGIAQCASLIPGMSRSASSIIGGVLGGIDYHTSARFSFLIAVPLILSATLFELSDVHLTNHEWRLIGFGMLISFLSGLVAIRWLLSIVSRVQLGPFAWYRMIVGILMLWLL